MSGSSGAEVGELGHEESDAIVVVSRAQSIVAGERGQPVQCSPEPLGEGLNVPPAGDGGDGVRN